MFEQHVENTATFASSLSDVELLTLLSLRRMPRNDDVWAQSGTRAAKLALREHPEFLAKNTLTAQTSDSWARMPIDFDAHLVTRAFKIFLGRTPAAEELSAFSQDNRFRLNDLVKILMFSAESLNYDGLTKLSEGTDLWREIQSKVAVQNFDLFAQRYTTGRFDYARQRGKAKALEAQEIKVLVHLFPLMPDDAAHIEQSIHLLAPGKDFRVTPWLGQDFPSVEDLSQYNIFVTNNNYLYKDTEIALGNIRATDCITVCWLWDNHHQFDFSIRCSEAFDLIVPAHSNGNTTLHFGHAIIGNTTPCCVFQWSAARARTLFEEYGYASRSGRLYGRFNSFEGRTALRDALLKRVAAEDGNDVVVVSARDNDWFTRSDAEKFQEIAGYETILVTPIFNDVPARLFDALVAGAIPIIPHGLPDTHLSISEQEMVELPVLTYLPHDLASLQGAHRLAREAFMRGGTEGAKARHQFACDHHFLRNRITTMLADTVHSFMTLR